MRRSRRSISVTPIWAAVLAGAVAGVWAGIRTARGRRASLRGQVAIVTGGARGLGLFIAHELARAGCKLVICGLNRDDLEEARRELDDAYRGADVLAVECDVGDAGAVDRLVAETVGRFGRVDVLVNNAALVPAAPSSAHGVSDFQAAMADGFWGTVYATMAVMPHMRAQRAGRIVNITAGNKGAPPHALPQECAKLAAVGFSEGMRAELARDGVSVTTVAPGLIRAPEPEPAALTASEDHERRWLSIVAQMPSVAPTPRSAARRIVAAAKRRDSETALGLPGALLRLARDLFPGVILRLFALTTRRLPRATRD
jgi:NAD(P)-dependent dehydrogenase (short-subunit alcohol dehydrogenase family)